jgi:hypothetical protein
MIGPDAFDVSPRGRIALLDEVHSRVLVIDPQRGSFRQLAVPIKGVADVAIDDQERVTVLDAVGAFIGNARYRTRQLYRLSPTGELEASAPIYAHLPQAFTSDQAVLDDDEVRLVAPLDAQGQPQSREEQRASRRRPDLLINWVSDTETRLADTPRGMAFELRSDSLLGSVPFFARTDVGYVVVFEWRESFRVVWFDPQGHILKDTRAPNQQTDRFSFNPVGRVALDGSGAIYLLGATTNGLEMYRVRGPE